MFFLNMSIGVAGLVIGRLVIRESRTSRVRVGSMSAGSCCRRPGFSP
jgi:hypothetical protein